MRYYDLVVAAARMIEKVNASRKEIYLVANRVCSALGKPIDIKQFNQAFKEWNQASGSKCYRPVYS
jgi:hypothetical protein